MSRRDTYTPQVAPQDLGNCDPRLKALSGRGGASGLKTLLNSPDEALTLGSPSGQDLRVPVVYVLNQRGKPLMPTTARKARVLLSKGKAKVTIRYGVSSHNGHMTIECQTADCISVRE